MDMAEDIDNDDDGEEAFFLQKKKRRRGERFEALWHQNCGAFFFQFSHFFFRLNSVLALISHFSISCAALQR